MTWNTAHESYGLFCYRDGAFAKASARKKMKLSSVKHFFYYFKQSQIPGLQLGPQHQS